MTRAEIKRRIDQQNENAERQARFDRLKAQLWRRISEALKNMPKRDDHKGKSSKNSERL
jgi:hypothetical protein